MTQIAFTSEAPQVEPRNPASRLIKFAKCTGLTLFALIGAPVIASHFGDYSHTNLGQPLFTLGIVSAVLSVIAALLCGYRRGTIVFGILAFLAGVTPFVLILAAYATAGGDPS